MLWIRLLLLLFSGVGIARPSEPKAKHPYWLKQSQWITPRRYSGQQLLDLTYEEVVNYNVRTDSIRKPQLEARRAFLDIYLSYPSNEPLDEEQMYLLLEQLDRYFFLGALTQGEKSFVDLEVAGGLDNLLGYTNVIPYDKPRVLVTMATTLRGEEMNKLSQVCTLSHEMVHAYIFVYWMGRIQGDKETVLGRYGDGHGEVFWRLWKPIVFQLQTWHRGLIPLCEKPEYKGYGPSDQERLQAYYEAQYEQTERRSILKKGLRSTALVIPFIIGLIRLL
jgi:hypothetical protein